MSDGRTDNGREGVALFGATGYSGREAARLLHGHPRFRLAAAFGGGGREGVPLSSIHPSLRGQLALAQGVLQALHDRNAIGWPKGHKFSDLTASDELTLALYDVSGVKRLEFQIDYLTASTSAPSGYKTLCVSGGDGKMGNIFATDSIRSMWST